MCCKVSGDRRRRGYTFTHAFLKNIGAVRFPRISRGVGSRTPGGNMERRLLVLTATQGGPLSLLPSVVASLFLFFYPLLFISRSLSGGGGYAHLSKLSAQFGSKRRTENQGARMPSEVDDCSFHFGSFGPRTGLKGLLDDNVPLINAN